MGEIIAKKEYTNIPVKVLFNLVTYFGSKASIAVEDARVFVANPDPAVFRNIFNLADIRVVKTLRKLILLEKVATNQKFYFNADHLDSFFEQRNHLKPITLVTNDEDEVHYSKE